VTASEQRRHLLVFARAPAAGRVKTRLIPAIGVAAATAVYREMLHNTLTVSARARADRHEIWVDRPQPAAELTTRARELDMLLRVQSGADLGARMHTAFAETLQTARAAVLVGTDCPEYDAAYLENAFEALESHDAVIGPARDGGYVLIGLKSAAPGLFMDIPWGTDKVLATTRDRLAQLRWRWFELPTMHDVDVPEDLARFPDLMTSAGVSLPDTAHE
jgi:rSAM/selenodomain-associated transferase 1